MKFEESDGIRAAAREPLPFTVRREPDFDDRWYEVEGATLAEAMEKLAQTTPEQMTAELDAMGIPREQDD